MTTSTRPAPTTDTAAGARRLFCAVAGLAGLAVLLQGLWAGMFIREGHHNTHSWVSIHAHGADVAILLAAVATAVALLRLRSRRDLVTGSIVLTLLLILEAYIGGIIGEHPGLTAVHIPLAMALMAVAVWLPLRAVYGGRTADTAAR